MESPALFLYLMPTAFIPSVVPVRGVGLFGLYLRATLPATQTKEQSDSRRLWSLQQRICYLILQKEEASTQDYPFFKVRGAAKKISADP